ncbi:flagellin [Shinella kummerowiae]|jgi:flagellin|uniref:Flagellin n=1 Tax=Shinella kummerowiae TaxID=417745 RepID=A0A6N8S714_9HYPH|nr:flagellin [Shinella kummerowiae]MCT7665875.1 flagellin [Shinella kummerowiae]MXN44523.1 flagellin [Shinella kummerowiae]
MSSILTNTSAMAALQTLRTINNDMETTQGRISSGQRVGAAKDNAAYWSIATTMRSDNAALSAVQDALGLGAAKVDVAYGGVEAAIDVVKTIKQKLVTATEQGVDKVKVQEEITQLQDQLKSIGASATFNGENWLAGGSAETTVVTGFVRGDDGTVKVTTATYDSAANALFGAYDPSTGEVDDSTGYLADTLAIELTDATTDAEVAGHLDTIETALTNLAKAGSNLGSLSMRIGLQEDFASKLTSALDKGIGRLVDADMNEESTRLKALQTQQQLAIQSLSIANSNSQNILSLFR